MDRQVHEFDGIRLRVLRTIGGDWKRLAFLQKLPGHFRENAGDHRTGMPEIETLGEGAWEVERFGNDFVQCSVVLDRVRSSAWPLVRGD